MTRSSPHPSVSVEACRRSYAELLLDKDASYPGDMPAYIDGLTGEVISRAAHRARALTFAGSLRNLESAGLKPLSRGSTVLVFSPNSILYPPIMVALAAAGISPAYANVSYKEIELAHAYRISRASHMLVHPSFLPVAVRTFGTVGIGEAEAKLRIILMTLARDMPQDLAAQGWVCIDQVKPRDGLVLPEKFDGSKADDNAVIYFSSGTTGMNKAVALSHLAITINLLGMATYWQYYKYQDIVLGVIPFYHIYGGGVCVLLSLYLGAPIVILPRFHPEQCLAAIERFKVTAAMIVPPILSFFATDPRVDKYDITSLRMITAGAAPVIPSMYDRCLERFAKRGVNLKFGSAYGLTEVAGLITWLPSQHVLQMRGSVGAVLPNMELRIVDDSGKDVPDGTPGELWLRGPCLMQGYVDNPEATAEAMTSDGWLKSGDVATCSPEGYLTIVDRRKELIKYKGFQVAPAEMESILSSHPGIADSAVIGVFSEKEGTELPRAYVVPKDTRLLKVRSSAAFTEEVNKWLADRVAHYKLLRGGIIFVDAVPRSPAGKILRKVLRELIQAEAKAKL